MDSVDVNVDDEGLLDWAFLVWKAVIPSGIHQFLQEEEVDSVWSVFDINETVFVLLSRILVSADVCKQGFVIPTKSAKQEQQNIDYVW